MVSALAVFGRVVDHAAVHLDLADGEVPLQVRRVVRRVPEAELDGAEQRQLGDGVAMIGDPRPPDLDRLAERDEVQRLDLDASAAGPDHRVPETVAAAVVLHLRSGGLPRRRPEVAARRVAQVEVPPAGIGGTRVVAVSREPAHPGVTKERVAARGVGDDPEEVLAAEVVDPRQRRVGSRDHVLASRVVELSEARHRPSSRVVRLGETSDVGSSPRWLGVPPSRDQDRHLGDPAWSRAHVRTGRAVMPSIGEAGASWRIQKDSPKSGSTRTQGVTSPARCRCRRRGWRRRAGWVAPVLPGVGRGEGRHRRVERVALAEVGVDGRGVTGGGMGASEDPAALASELAQPRCDLLARGDHLHVAGTGGHRSRGPAPWSSRRRCRWSSG